MTSRLVPNKNMRSNVLPVLAAFLSTLLAMPSAMAASFPQYPLQTGASNVAPNILFILDDSGSMTDSVMTNPDLGTVCRRQSNGNCASGTTISDDVYTSNTLKYNPATAYQSWITHSGTRMSGGQTFPTAFSSNNLGSGSTTNLSSSVQTFYVPKDTTRTDATYLGNSLNYYRFQIRTMGGASRVIRSELVLGGGLGTATSSSTRTWNVTVNGSTDWRETLTLDANQTLDVQMTGTGNAALRLYTSDWWGNYTVVCEPLRNNSTEQCTANTAGDYMIRVTRQGNNNSSNGTVTITSTVSDANNGCQTASSNTYAWGNCSFTLPASATSAGRDEAAELNNYTTWYSYHRTRMKLAKAGASEAFALLGDNVRVGYRTIWNNNNYDIPVGLYEDNREGVFKGTARETWFNSLFGATGNNGTPLRGALDAAGQYFSGTEAGGPYGPQSGSSQLQCRQNFAILTTDGYWNSNFGSISTGDQEGSNGERIIDHSLRDTDPNYNIARYQAGHPFRDGNNLNRENTLADVAMKYWKSDLRTDMDNIVPRSSTNPAFWQHMVTFGISIGLKGSLDQSSVAQIRRDGRPRLNGTEVSWPDPQMTNQSGTAEIPARVDDLLHAAVNGHGEFIAATSANGFRDALNSVLGQIQARLASGSNVATNSTSFQSNTSMYQATYMSGLWTGDLIARDVTEAGGISSEIDWQVSQRISASMTDSNNRNDFDDRTVMTWSGTAGAAFPTGGQSTLLARATGAAIVTGPDNANYIKGSQALEQSNRGLLRNRSLLLGDIVNSSPFYVKDTETIYVGANDGMLHAVNALTGDVVFSYVPAGLDFAKLASLSDPDYVHNFFVDGPVTVSSQNVQTGTNYLVGTLGRGGKGVFALDVSDPSRFAARNVLWDRTVTTDTDMGYVLGAPVIARGNNDEVLAIVPNGIDSTNGDAVLYVYDVATGTQRAKIAVGRTGDNGLSAPRAADVNGDGKVDYVYAGDLHGNVWKFDLSAASPSSWGVGLGGAPLFTAVDDAGNAQPITGGLAIAREPGNRRIWVTFGTGRLISLPDLDASQSGQQSIYGIIDDGTAVADRDELTIRTIAAVSTDLSKRAFESFTALPTDSRGWYINLGVPLAGERVVSGPRIDGRAVWVSSVVPDAGDGCESGGTGYLNALDVFTGTSPGDGSGNSISYFDLDGNGSGDNDYITDSDGNRHAVGSVNLNIGMPTESSQIDELVLVCGSDGTCKDVKVPPGIGQPKRLGWREIFSR
ncbi:PilC/PilY family type IV pilus protein [Pseudoxanthomonas beigongshangi]